MKGNTDADQTMAGSFYLAAASDAGAALHGVDRRIRPS